MDKLSKVSVIIPVYNGANYLKYSIDSALNQTYENIEIIVINDGSKDDGATEKIALSYGNKIKYLYKENGGVSTALNAGIKASTGEWISWLSHDDLYSPDKIAEQINDFNTFYSENTNTEKTLFYCYGGFIDKTGKKINKRHKRIKSGYHSPGDALYSIFNNNTPGGCGFLIPKTLFNDIGYFDESLRYSQDLFMWIKAHLAGYGMYVNTKCMSFTRIHNQQASTTLKPLALKDQLRIGNYLIDKLSGIKTSNKKNVEIKYLLFSARKRLFPICELLNKKLADEGILTICDKLLYRINLLFGLIRPKLVTLYYKLIMKTRR